MSFFSVFLHVSGMTDYGDVLTTVFIVFLPFTTPSSSTWTKKMQEMDAHINFFLYIRILKEMIYAKLKSSKHIFELLSLKNLIVIDFFNVCKRIKYCCSR